jgi:WD40 repeat protein
VPSIESVAFSQNCDQILVGFSNLIRTASLYDTQTGQLVRDFDVKHSQIPQFEGDSSNSIQSVAVSLDGRSVLLGLIHGRAVLFAAKTGKKIHEMTLDLPQTPDNIWGSPVDVLAFSHDGGKTIVGCHDKTSLWDLHTGTRIGDLATNKSRIDSVAFSPDNQSIATGSDDGTVLLWDRNALHPLRHFAGHIGPVRAILFTSDGRRLISGSWDGTIRVWDVATGEELVRLLSYNHGHDWLAATPAGLFDGSIGARQTAIFRVGNGLETIPAESLASTYYRPGLLAKIWRGERASPTTTQARGGPGLEGRSEDR